MFHTDQTTSSPNHFFSVTHAQRRVCDLLSFLKCASEIQTALGDSPSNPLWLQWHLDPERKRKKPQRTSEFSYGCTDCSGSREQGLDPHPWVNTAHLLGLLISVSFPKLLTCFFTSPFGTSLHWHTLDTGQCKREQIFLFTPTLVVDFFFF